MRDAKPRKRFVGASKMPGIGLMMRKDARAAEEARQHHVASGGVRGARSQQVRRNNAKKRAQLKNIPPLAPQYGNGGPFPREWITLPGNGLDQRGLAATVGPKNTKVFAGPDLQCDVVEGGPLFPRAAQDGHVFQEKERRRRGGHF